MAVDTPGWSVEERAIERGCTVVAGCDEVGRGPLAGPVVAAAVILKRGAEPDGLNDSKRLSPQRRLVLYHALWESAVVGVGLAGTDEIDRHNILQASLLAMRRAVLALGCRVDYLLVDGNQRVPELDVPQEPLVKGDSRSVSVAAASIVAKVTRDAVMEMLDRLHPGYGFASNKGYPSAGHLAALDRLGPCAAHRASYGPVRARMADPPPLPPAKSRGGRQLSLFGDGLEP